MEAIVHINPITDLDFQTVIEGDNITSVLTYVEAGHLHYRMRVNGAVIDEGAIPCLT